jgi:ZIP family zinc transporter
MPFVRRVSTTVVRFFMALTVGLLAFLAVDALVEGFDIGSTGPQVFGGPTLVLLGALVAFIALMAVDAFVKARAVGAEGYRLSLLIAIGIGLHNLGEGLAIGSAYAIGELALGAFLVVGFALHNTTEGLAVVAPIAHDRPPWPRLLGLGLIAGGPAIVGAWIGGVAYSAPLAAFLLGFGVGAILQVAWQLLPTLRGKERGARAITPLTAAGLASGLLIMYATGLLAG